MVSDELVDKIDSLMNGRFKTRTYKSKTAKLLCIMDKFLKAEGDIELDVCYRRLRYYADTSSRGNLQITLVIGKELFKNLT